MLEIKSTRYGATVIAFSAILLALANPGSLSKPCLLEFSLNPSLVIMKPMSKTLVEKDLLMGDIGVSLRPP